MNNDGSGAIRKPESYSVSTDLNTTHQQDNTAQPVKTLVPLDASATDVSIQPVVERQDVAAAHPIGDIVVEAVDVVTAPAKPRRRIRPRIPKPHVPRVRPLRVHTFDSFQHVNYRFLWVSMLFFSGAFWMQQLVVGWLTYELTQSALLTSIAMGLDALPILIAGPLGGALVDRWDKGKLLAGIFIYQSALAFVFGAMVLAGIVNVWHVFAFIFLMGVSWVISDPARMALIPSIVPRHSLVNAFALNSLAFSVTRLAIPAVGGALLAFAGAGVAMLLEGVMVAVAATLALGLNVATAAPKSRLNMRAVISEILEGARYIRERPVVLGLLLFGFLPTMLVSPFLYGLIPVYAVEVFAVGPATLGLLMSAVGAGFLIGTLALASIGDTRHKGWMILGSIALICVSMLAFALNPTILMAYPLVALGSVGTMGFFSMTTATMQSILPDGIRGRVSGIYILTFGAMPLGNLAAGVIAQDFGAPVATLSACGVIIVAAVALALKFPSIRKI